MPFMAYEIKVTRGTRRGQTARVVGYDDPPVCESGEFCRARRLSCKFSDGTYAMIRESSTKRQPFTMRPVTPREV
jgi:hypothetical protein